MKNKTQNETAAQSQNLCVIMSSDDFGGEEFRVDSLADAYKVVSNLALSSQMLNDSVLRRFEIVEVQE